HRHNDRARFGKLLQDFAPNRRGTGRQILVGSIIQKKHAGLLGVLRSQRERRRQIAASALHDSRSQRPNAPTLHWIAVRRQEYLGLDSKLFRGIRHRRSVIPGAASHHFFYLSPIHSLRQCVNRTAHLERSRWQLRLQFQINALACPLAEKWRGNQPRRREILRQKSLRLSNRGNTRNNSQSGLSRRRIHPTTIFSSRPFRARRRSPYSTPPLLCLAAAEPCERGPSCRSPLQSVPSNPFSHTEGDAQIPLGLEYGLPSVGL